MYRTVFWTLWEKARVGWSARIALKHVYYHIWNRSPVQVRCMRQGARGWCTGMTLRDGMGREVGGGFRMGDTYTPMADSCQCMVKPLQYCKVKINKTGEKKKGGKMRVHLGLNSSLGNVCVGGKDMVQTLSQYKRLFKISLMVFCIWG